MKIIAILPDLDSQSGGFCNSESDVCLGDSTLTLCYASVDSAIIPEVKISTDLTLPSSPADLVMLVMVRLFQAPALTMLTLWLLLMTLPDLIQSVLRGGSVPWR